MSLTLLPFCKSWGHWSKQQLFFFNVKILIPFRISFCFPGKPLNVQMFCVFLLNSIMTSSASKWTLSVVNILIMLITSCDSIDTSFNSILVQFPEQLHLPSAESFTHVLDPSLGSCWTEFSQHICIQDTSAWAQNGGLPHSTPILA